MENLQKIMNGILEVYNSDLSNDEKYEKVSNLWTSFYKYCNNLENQYKKCNDFAKMEELRSLMEAGYRLYLMCENECYKIYQEPIIKNINKESVIQAVAHLKEVISKKMNGINDGISREEANLLLDWVVYHVRSSLEGFGIDIRTNSLNGFCELSQALSIMPFENLGVRVTKNKAQDAFEYPFNHAFGTVWLPILENGKVEESGYLVDTTYRQFFSSVRCNEGRYYTKEVNTGIVANPDPGYFVKDEKFAKDLMANGYVVFNKENAYKYGEGFYLASLGIGDQKKYDEETIDYYQAILESSSDYSISANELEGLSVDFPSFVHKSFGR